MAGEANKNVQTKADVILQNGLVLDKKVENIALQTNSVASDVAAVKKACEQTASEQGFIARQNSEIFEKLSAENNALKQELMYISAQNENIYTGIAKLVNQLQDEVASLKKKLEEVPTPAPQPEEPVVEEVEVLGDDEAIEEVVPEIDYDVIAEKVADRLVVPAPEKVEIDYDKLAEGVAQKMGTGVDSDEICQKVYDKMLPVLQAISVQEVISPDYVASKVAEQIVIPAGVSQDGTTIDYNSLANRVANQVVEKIGQSAVSTVSDDDFVAVAATPTVDEEALATRLADKIADMLDSEEFTDKLVKKVGTVSPEEFDVMVDDDGCDALAESVCAKLDYDLLSSKIVEKLGANETEVDADEIATKVSEKVNVVVDSEEIATKVSEKVVITVDTDEIATKVSEKVNVVVDSEEIATKVSEKVDVVVDEDAIATKVSEKIEKLDANDVAENVAKSVICAIPVPTGVNEEKVAQEVVDKIIAKQDENDYDVVIDDEGVAKLTELVAEKIEGANKERFDKIDAEIESIKEMLSGAMVAVSESAIAEDEELVKVSDIIDGDEQDGFEDGVMEDIVNDIDEQPTDDEIMPDGIPGISNGVDFGNMMKYNRSFIARIIQSSDDMKNYYGETKSALLAYKKVNSSIAWGAERFNKGRETIARFKIRGKTLCLYLALDPNEYKTSVYHHSDVSDNKSMSGTPMMLKIKSPLGVKKAVRLIDEMLEKRGGVKQAVQNRDYAAMYPYETTEQLIEEGLVKDVSKK